MKWRCRNQSTDQENAQTQCIWLNIRNVNTGIETQTKKALETHAPKLWHISISSGVPMEMHSAVGMATFIRNIMEIYNVTILSKVTE